MNKKKERDWKATREWFKRFEQDRKEVLIAANEWQWESIWLLSRIGREENAQQLWNVESEGPVVVPRWFIDLTSLLVTWCDESLKVVDATPLLQFREYTLEFARRGCANMSTCFDDLEQIVGQCLKVIDRVRHRVKLRGTGVDVTGDESSSDGDWVRGPFGLSVDLEGRRVRREGYSRIIDLSNNCPWAIFRILFEAQGEQGDLKLMQDRYPGDWNDRTRGQIYHRLRAELKHIDITVERRRLKPLHC